MEIIMITIVIAEHLTMEAGEFGAGACGSMLQQGHLSDKVLLRYPVSHRAGFPMSKAVQS